MMRGGDGVWAAKEPLHVEPAHVTLAARCPGRFFSRYPIVFKSNTLHAELFQVFFIESEYISIDPSKIVGYFPEVLNFNRLFLKLNWVVCN
jgi:hypothetical protein